MVDRDIDLKSVPRNVRLSASLLLLAQLRRVFWKLSRIADPRSKTTRINPTYRGRITF